MKNKVFPCNTPPNDSRDVLTYGDWGPVVAMYLSEINAWVTGFEDVFVKAGVPFDFEPREWTELPDCTQFTEYVQKRKYYG
jgi:hypothetical protein